MVSTKVSFKREASGPLNAPIPRLKLSDKSLIPEEAMLGPKDG